MGRREVIDCDSCGGRELTSYATLWVATAARMDASGNGSDDEGETIYLCARCCQDFIAERLKLADYKANAKWLEDVKAKRRRLAKATT